MLWAMNDGRDLRNLNGRDRLSRLLRGTLTIHLLDAQVAASAANAKRELQLSSNLIS